MESAPSQPFVYLDADTPPEHDHEVVSDLVGSTDLFLFAYSPSNRSLTWWSTNAARVLGVRDLSLARDGNLFLRHVHPDDRFFLLTQLEQALQGRTSYRSTYRWIRPDTNELRWLHCRASLSHEDPPLLRGVIVDLTDEWTDATTTHGGPESLQVVLSALPTTIITLDRDLRIVRISHPAKAAPITFGDPDFQQSRFSPGSCFLDCFVKVEVRDYYARALQSIIQERSAYFRSRIDDPVLPRLVEMHPLRDRDGITGALCMVSNVSELAKLEQELALARRDQNMQNLTSSMASYLNNTLQVILGHASAMKLHSNRPDLTVAASQAIIDLVGQSTELSRRYVEQVTAGSRKIGTVDLNVVSMMAVNRLNDLTDQGVHLSITFGSAVLVNAPMTALSVAIEMLLRECLLIMKGIPCTLAISSAVIEPSEEFPHARAQLCCLIDPVNRGTGKRETSHEYGDAVHTITQLATSVQGSFSEERTVLGGFRYSLTLPRAAETAILLRGREGRSAQPVRRPEPQTVLLAEGDPVVRQATAEIIQSLGLPCLQSGDAREVFRTVRSSLGAIALVLVDSSVGRNSGSTLIRRLRRASPDLAILALTGEASAQAQHLIRSGAQEVIVKPVDGERLKGIFARYLPVNGAR